MMLTIQKVWDIAYALHDLYYAGILDINCFYTICTNAEDAQDFAQLLIFLHQKILLTPESHEAICKHVKQSKYIFKALEYLHYKKILNQKTFYIICKYLGYAEEIAEALGALYRAEILNKKNFYTICRYLDQVKGIARALEALGILARDNFNTIIENAEQSLNIAKTLQCVDISQRLNNFSNYVISINQKNFHTFCEHLDRAKEIAEAFQSLNDLSIPLDQYYFDAICENQKLAQKIPIYVKYIKTTINQYAEKIGEEYQQMILYGLSELVDEANPEDDVVENIRRLLQPIMKHWERCWGFSIKADAAHIALLILAKFHPINKYDLYEESIPLDKRMVMSSGHQFNIEQLAKYTTNINGTKHYINPYTDLKFNPKDEQRISEKLFERQTCPKFNLRGFRNSEDPERQTNRDDETAADTEGSEITLVSQFTP